jgi:WxL Interacting Protein, peptidoglycan binding domain
MRLRLLVLTLALVYGAVVVSFAGAAAPAPADASFALKPVMYDPALTATKSYFILSVKPGALVKDQVRIVNTGGKTGTAFLYPVDATTGQTSGAVYLSRQSPRRDVASWIVLSRSRVTLAPGADAVVPFTVRVPKFARPGDHLGGLVAENSQIQKSNGGGALQIKIRHLTIAAVEVQLPSAPVATVAATGVKPGGEHGYQFIYVHLKSTGNVLVKPAATLTVRNATGRVVARRRVQLDTFVPGTEIDYPAILPRQALKPGRYTAEVRLHTSKNRVLGYRKVAAPPFDVTRTFPFTVTSNEQTKVFSGVAPVTPPQKSDKPKSSKRNYELAAMAGLIGLLLVVLLLIFLRLRRARKRGQAPSAGPAPVAASGAPPKPEPSAPAADDGDEEPGWAGLLAAYESQPRHQTNGWHEQPELEPEAEPVSLVAVAAAAAVPEPGSEQVPDRGSEQVSAWGQTPVESEPVFEPEVTTELAPSVAPEAVALWAVDTPEAVVEEVQAPVDPESQFDLQPEPWFDPEPEVEVEVPTDPRPTPDPEVLLMAAEWFGSEHEPEPEPAPQPTVIAPDDLEQLIVGHDLAVAESYFRPPAHPVAEPAPAPPSPGRARNAESDASHLSSTLVEASLIALAAVLATRLLRSAE